MSDELEPNARAATLDRLQETTIRNFLDPIPSRDALRAMLEGAGIPRFKANPQAKRGGGPVYYSVSAVEKFLRNRLLSGSAATRLRTLPAGAMVQARGPVIG